MKETLIENAPLFADLTDAQRDLIACRMTLETRRAGDVIFSQGQPSAAIYLIKSGRARLVNDQLLVLANLVPGSTLGDADVLSGRNYTVSAEAATNVEMWALSALDLASLIIQDPDLGRQLKLNAGIAEDQFAERHLRRLALLNGLSGEQIQEVARHLRSERFSAGQVIYRRGEQGNALYLIEQGRVSIQAKVAGAPPQILDTLEPGESFGETALTGEAHATEAVAETDVAAWSLSKSDFEALILRFPSLALNLSRILSHRLRDTEQVITSVRIAPAPVSPAPTGRAAPVTGAVTGLNRAAAAATSWWGARSTGAKLRLVAVILLLIWLLGVAAPSAIISLLSGNNMARQTTNSLAAATNVRERVMLVALAADLPIQTTPTYTPWPTETPIPTPTFTPTATPTNTPIPTATFTPTATPVPPTNTPTPRPTAVVVRAAPAAVAAAAPAPTKPAVQFKLVEMRRLTPCENRGKHNIFVKVIDAAGNPVDGVTLLQVPHGQIGNVLDKMVTGAKGPGLAEFIMWKMAEYDVYVSLDGSSPASTDIAQQVHSNFPADEMCADGEGGNTLFHNSFSLVFQKTF